MNNKYNRISGIVFIAASLLFAACNNDNDIDGTLERVDLLSEITIEKTAYHTGDQSMCMLPGQEIQLNCIIGSPEAQNRNYVWTSSNSEVASVLKNVAGIVTFTSSGFTTFLAAKERPALPIIAITPDEKVAHQMSLVWGVRSFINKESFKSFDKVEKVAVEIAKKSGLAKSGDHIIITAGFPLNIKGRTNMLHTVYIP